MPAKKKKAAAGSALAQRNRKLALLDNKIRRTVYAIVDYHQRTTGLNITEKEANQLANAAYNAILQGGGLE